VKVTISYDPAIDAWTLRHENVIIRTDEEAAEWRRQLAQCFEGKSGFLLIDMDDYDLDPAFLPTYGKTVKELTYSRWSGVIRYGGDNQFSHAALRINAIDNKYPAHIMPDRKTAIEVLEHMRSLAAR
jgi:hypothetical protein